MKKEHVKGRKVVMIGDGVNDSPALSEADVGVAIHSGAAIAREVADVSIDEDHLMNLVTLRELSSKLESRTRSTYHAIIGYNSALIILAMFGLLTPTLSALLHNGSTTVFSLHSTTNLLPRNFDDEEEVSYEVS